MCCEGIPARAASLLRPFFVVETPWVSNEKTTASSRATRQQAEDLAPVVLHMTVRTNSVFVRLGAEPASLRGNQYKFYTG